MFILLFYQYITVAGGFGCPGSTVCSPTTTCICDIGTGGSPLGGCCNDDVDCASGKCGTTDFNPTTGENKRCVAAEM